jgi:uncharacterized membrane protein
VAALVLAQNDLPKPTGGFEVSPTFFIVLFGIGFLVGVVGHLARSRTLVAAGVILIFLATIFIPIYLQVTR